MGPSRISDNLNLHPYGKQHFRRTFCFRAEQWCAKLYQLDAPDSLRTARKFLRPDFPKHRNKKLKPRRIKPFGQRPWIYMNTYVVTAGRQSQNTAKADFFELSIQRCNNIHWIYHKRGENKNSRSGFGWKDFRDFMVWKSSCAQHTCSTLPQDATIVVSDIDIVWRSSAFGDWALAQNAAFMQCAKTNKEI